MSNELVLPGDPLAPFEEFGRSASRKFLKHVKGQYVAGTDGATIPIGTEMVVQPDGIELGWIHWADGRPDDERIGRLADGYRRPTRKELGDNDQTTWPRDENGVPSDPWRETWSVPMADIATGEPYLFTTGSKGGSDALKKLSSAWAAHARAKPDEYPVVRLSAGSYMHPIKSRGRIFFPIFEILDWITKDAVPGEGDQGSGPAPTTAPAQAVAPKPDKQQPEARQRRATPLPPTDDEIDVPW
jgi:hypothetical protein